MLSFGVLVSFVSKKYSSLSRPRGLACLPQMYTVEVKNRIVVLFSFFGVKERVRFSRPKWFWVFGILVLWFRVWLWCFGFYFLVFFFVRVFHRVEYVQPNSCRPLGSAYLTRISLVLFFSCRQGGKLGEGASLLFFGVGFWLFSSDGIWCLEFVFGLAPSGGEIVSIADLFEGLPFNLFSFFFRVSFRFRISDSSCCPGVRTTAETFDVSIISCFLLVFFFFSSFGLFGLFRFSAVVLLFRR